jgi:hypothetical protein
MLTSFKGGGNLNLSEIKTREYSIPLNVSKSAIKRYEDAISNDYAKYIYTISICGGGCMLSQFIDLLIQMDLDTNISREGYVKRARIILRHLEELGFVETGYLNRNKYIILKHPAVALAEGDYRTHKRVSARELFKSDKFTYSITKMQALLDYGFVYQYTDLWDQLVGITEIIKEAIVSSGNKKGYDISFIDQIIESADHKRASDMLDENPEHIKRIGPVRLLWSEVASLFKKLPQKGCIVSSEPFYLNVFTQDDGLVTLHYVPNIVIYDTMKDLDFYETQNTFLSNGFYGIKGNNTLGMKEEFIKSNTLGFEHFNRLGYTVALVGTNKEALEKKKNIIDIPFDNGGIHTPMVNKSKCYVVDIERYINHSNVSIGKNDFYEETVENIEKTVGRLVSVLNEA